MNNFEWKEKMKYIIKNCPAINDRLCKLEEGLTHCVDISNCLLKQIVDECKGLIWQNEDYIKISDIINLLEIKEANE